MPEGGEWKRKETVDKHWEINFHLRNECYWCEVYSAANVANNYMLFVYGDITRITLLLFSCLVMSNSLRPHGLWHSRLPCPLSPRVCSNPCPLSRWCYPIISSSISPFSSCPRSFQLILGSFPVSWLFTSVGQSIGASGSGSVLSINIHGWLSLGLNGLILLLSERLKSLLHHHSLKASILQFPAFFKV